METEIRTLSDIGSNKLVAVCREPHCRHQHPVDVDRLKQHVGGHQPLMPQPGQHFTDSMRCPRCRRRGMNLWLIPVTKRQIFKPSAPAAQLLADANYRVVDHGRFHPEENLVIAGAQNLFVAKAAYTAASHFYSDHRVTLLQGAFVVADNRRDGPPDVMPAEAYREMRAIEAGMINRPAAVASGSAPEFVAIGPASSEALGDQDVADVDAVDPKRG